VRPRDAVTHTKLIISFKVHHTCKQIPSVFLAPAASSHSART